MSGSMKDNEIPELIENLNTSDPEQLNDTLQSLILTLQAEQGKEIVYHFGTLFPRLETLLSDENLSIVVQASQLLVEAVTNFASDVEPYYYQVVGKLVINLGDSRVSKSSSYYLLCVASGQKDGFE